MTLVNHDTGEIVETIGAEEARRLTTEAQNEFRSSREHFDRAWSLIEQAVEGGGHLELGYRSPGDYLHQEFDGVLSGLDVPSRRVAVKTMTEWGLSTRAIAQPLGVNHATVVRDRARGADAPPHTSQDAPETPLAENGIERSAETTEAEGAEPAPSLSQVGASEVAGKVPAADDLGAAIQPERGVDPPSPPALSIVGIDGKTYRHPDSKPSLKPVINEDEWTKQDRAEELAADLAGHLSLLFALTVPERRAEYIENWHLGVDHRPVLGQKYVKPSVMRQIADALHTFASEWENANV